MTAVGLKSIQAISQWVHVGQIYRLHTTRGFGIPLLTRCIPDQIRGPSNELVAWPISLKAYNYSPNKNQPSNSCSLE
jgi:hypothetical protein